MTNFVCLRDKAPLSFEKRRYICKICGKVYPIIDGIPIFLDDPENFESEERQYTKEHISSLETRAGKNKKSQKLNFYIRSRPKQILLQKGYKNKRGIDIGCGTGKNENFEHIYTNVSKDVIGAEVSLSAAKGFNENFRDVPCILATELPFKDESFDFITTSGLVHHLIGQSNIILTSFNEWYRVLKKGGIFICNDPNLFFPLSLVMHIPNRILQKVRPGARGRVPYERPISFFEVRNILKKVGFKNTNFMASTFANWSMPSKTIKYLISKEKAFIQRVPFKYFGAWITIYAEK